MWRVLITSTTLSKAAPESIRVLQGAGVEVLFTSIGRRLEDHELASLVGEVDGIIAGVDRIGPRSLAAALPRLKVIARYGMGCDSIDVATATELGIVVTNTPDANSASVADLVFGLILVLARHIGQADRAMHEGRWGRFLGCELLGKRLGVIGFGRVGKAVAGRAGGFGMDVFAFDPVWDEQAARKLGVRLSSLETILEECDFVSLHVPHGLETHHLIGEVELKRMKPTAYLINTSRGGIMDEQALVRALREGWIRGAALDVFEGEPVSNPELLTAPHLLLTPHLGACTFEAGARMGRMAVENLLAVLQGHRPPHVVNPDVYARQQPGLAEHLPCNPCDLGDSKEPGPINSKV
jgi:D-3-phosphoglycerate dehydrogenase